jgi:hypothetical protein
MCAAIPCALAALACGVISATVRESAGGEIEYPALDQEAAGLAPARNA